MAKQKTEAAPEIHPERLEGRKEGYNIACSVVLEALGINQTAAQEDEGGEEDDSSPLCVRCRHSKGQHQPLGANCCFEGVCACKGYLDKFSWVKNPIDSFKEWRKK